MIRASLVATAAALLLSSLPALAVDLEAEGLIEVFTDPTTCIQGRHVITDPCTGVSTIIDEFMVDPDPHVCDYSRVTGPDVGITCSILGTATIVTISPTCPNGIIDLRCSGQDETIATWRRVPCSTSHDLIRAGIPGPVEGVSEVDLGAVVCQGNDLTGRFVITRLAGPPDNDVPPPGTAYMYLARGNSAPYGGDSYGSSSNGNLRVPASGFCP